MLEREVTSTPTSDESCAQVDADSSALDPAVGSVVEPTLDAAVDSAVEPALDSVVDKRLPLPFKIFGILCIAVGLLVLPLAIFAIAALVDAFSSGLPSSDADIVSSIMVAAQIAIALCIFALSFALGIQLLRNRRRYVAVQAYILSFAIGASAVLDIMIDGFTIDLLFNFACIFVFVALSSYADPALSAERKLQRKLRSMEDRSALEAGTLGRDESGKGYITLNFFNLFWIFIVACVLGDLIETVYHMTVVDFGHFQNRAGLLYGPFSPIYGLGAMFMTIALNRFYKSNVVVIFLVSALIGGSFEYLVSWFFQFAFGIQAWDYTGTFLNIGGRTNFRFMCMWGVLGIVWIKLLLPQMLVLVNRIPWNMRYTVTTICTVLMLVNATLTLVSFDRWYERLAGSPPESSIEQFADDHYDNNFMQNRFQTMTINPDSALRNS